MVTISILGGVLIFAFLYSFADAWHDEKVITNERTFLSGIPMDWHTVDAFIKLLVSVFVGIVVWFYTQDYVLAGIVTLGIILVRASTFNFFLNKLMNYPKDHRKSKGLDRIPTWIWWILLAGLITFAVVKYY